MLHKKNALSDAAMQSQKAVTSYLSSKLLLSFGISGQYCTRK